MATTDEGTRTALAEADRRRATFNDGRVILLVIRIASYFRTTIDPRDDARVSERYRRLIDDVGAVADVRLCVARRPADALRWMLDRRTVIVIGGCRRWWWPTREQRVAHRLKKAGGHVIFAEAPGTAGSPAGTATAQRT
ncbi:MAG TPA: hypothetical protein VHU82_09545 [Vicinamibacterales bacterium]|nr:hypothetical protein [Vicinamibacterales bacterium]